MNITYACSRSLLNNDFFNFNYIKGFVDVDTSDSDVVYLRFTSETTKTVATQLGFASEQMVFQYYSTLVRTYLDNYNNGSFVSIWKHVLSFRLWPLLMQYQVLKIIMGQGVLNL